MTAPNKPTRYAQHLDQAAQFYKFDSYKAFRDAVEDGTEVATNAWGAMVWTENIHTRAAELHAMGFKKWSDWNYYYWEKFEKYVHVLNVRMVKDIATVDEAAERFTTEQLLTLYNQSHD